MISTDFAPNESWDDAWLSFKLLFQPCKWKKGKEIEKVKKSIKQLITNNQQLSVSLFLSGRSALYFLLKSLKLPKSCEVVIQAFTCEAVILPILANKLKPVYIDIEKETFSMEYQQLANRITDNCRVLIVQHTFGLTPKYRELILKLAKERKLVVIEDLAHGFNPRIFQTSNQSPVTRHYFLLSFGRSKLLSSVFGGAVVSFNNESMRQWKNLSCPSFWVIFRYLLYKPLAVLIKSTYDIYLGKILHKILNSLGLLIPEITPKEKVGRYNQLFNKAYPNALSILLLHQLKKFEQIKQNRAKICQIYSRNLRPVKNGIRFLPLDLLRSLGVGMTTNGLIRFPLLINDRERILKEFRKHNVFLGKWYDQVVGPSNINLDRVEYKKGSCPNAEEICKKIINLPTNITEKEAKWVTNTLFDVL